MLLHAPVTVEAPPTIGLEAAECASPGARTRIERWSSLATPWLLAPVAAVAFYFAYVTYDLLQYRMLESSVQFEAGVRRFERFWVLHDTTVEAAQALKRDLSEPAPGNQAQTDRPDAAALADDGHRFVDSSDALRIVLGTSGIVCPEQVAIYADSASRLGETLDGTADGGAPLSSRGALARTQVQRVLDVLSLQARQARQQQSTYATFLDRLDAARRQLLLAFAVIVTLLVLAFGFCLQWVMVARRERAIRGRAEHLAEVAEAERRRAEEVARDKARFLGMLSHELLTPLQSIWSTMDVIESRGRVDAHDAAFTRLRESTRSLRGRISDLVDFAKMSSGRLEARVRGFQLDKLVDSALRDVEEALAAKNLDVHWEPAPDLSRRIYSDPARLRQIVDNLLSNAVKYTERGGITITAQLAADTSLLRLEIADTGAGIQPEALERLFEPFYRAPATAAMAEGSGLGLAVVRSLIDLMGGEIHVQSRVGQGTSMVVEVPVAECLDGLIDAPRQLDVQRPVLIVDDSRDARRAIADVIRSLGFDVYEADGGLAGLAEAQLRDYHAILLDLQMPDLDGYHVALRLREPGHRHEHTFIALVSAYNDLDDASADAVFDARIDKPVTRRDLVAALARASERARDPAAASNDEAGRVAADDAGGPPVSHAASANEEPAPPAPTG